jgi:hypothetical protein
MSINLNDSKFAGTRVFNAGKAGLAQDVTVKVTKKTDEDHERAPDYRLVFTDESGGEINTGFYYFEPRDGATKEEVERSQGYELGRYVHLARAVMGDDYELPTVNDMTEALDTVMTLVRDNVGSKKFNIYTNYGTVGYAKQYLQVRKYNFIEPADVKTSTLYASSKDIMEPVQPDAPAETSSVASSGWS